MGTGFNLIDEPWILAQRRGGSVDTVSLLRLFADAEDYVRLTGDLPTQALPILRLMLAIVHQAVDGPRDRSHWLDLWKAEGLPLRAIEDYLNEHRHRFDLVHPKSPFYQVADLDIKRTERSLAVFIADVPTGDPKYATRAAEGLARIGLGEAARWLVHCHAFDVAGIKGAAFGDPRAKKGKSYPIGPGSLGLLGAVYAEGANLAETILLNLIPDEFLSRRGELDPTDVPSWEREPHGPGPEQRDGEGIPRGLRDLYSWQSRRVRLFVEEKNVESVIICQGDRLQILDQFRNEPMTAWQRSLPLEKQTKSADPMYMPRRHDPARAVWRGLAATLQSMPKRAARGVPSMPPLIIDWISEISNRLGRTKRIGYHVTGVVYGKKNVSIAEVIDDRLTVAAAVFDPEDRELANTVTQAVRDADRSIGALANLARGLARAAGDRDGVEGAAARASESAYAALDVEYRDWLAELDPDSDTDAAATEWQRSVRRAVLTRAEQLVNTTGAAAWRGRTIEKRLVNSSIVQNEFQRRLYRLLPLAYAKPGDPTDENGGR
ncbi:type I-E CRISPR-associated protein Cse1/CasA [Glycomyces endophyticus]|uniref:Type I-E CRISPR-associated protein Cse1/CasA n=1 Tax=Glycomyces endophyticus TaxID=480996 RepID=A0ABP4RUW8_9ACTN